MGEDSAAATASIDSSNIGFKLLKKHGWKEGTGLGVSGQVSNSLNPGDCLNLPNADNGRLEPVQAYLKKNKRGLGADKVKKTAVGSYENLPSNGKTDKAFDVSNFQSLQSFKLNIDRCLLSSQMGIRVIT
ncbi:hypothetical protein CK203_014562 [Vitis vinifera]|uniref:G-patch domain-containing protein n=1 Tax=Vitis vinifera TaxID=29760 RepID=A0A438K511_VITVI|nr:hypothetical protein CK203_014562 [Vitis vinifera]